MKYLLTLIAVLLLIGCGAHRQVSIASTRPADIDVSSNIQNLLIVNRTDGSRNILTTIEGVLTGEMLHEDRAAVQAFIGGLNRELQYSERYQTRVASEILPGNSITNSFPRQLDWYTVEGLCRQYRSDALLAIEVLDTDFIITQTKEMIEVKDKKGNKVKVAEYTAEGVANMRIGIRFYDPGNRSLIDQDMYRRTNTWTASARTEADALAHLISKAGASSYLANKVGANYASRIAPMPININRSFVGKAKKSPEVALGARYSDVGQWDQAVLIWERGLKTAPQKEAGILSLNMAIAYEIMGDIDQAIHWSQVSYTTYGNKKAKKYYHDLLQRLDNEARADQQLQL